MAGWWSYSFCYMNEIRQFHALPPGNGIPVFPPVEDTNSKAFVLGKFTPEQDIDLNKEAPSTELAELHTTGDSRYLVQRLKRGTKCDLTGREREIEVQFHCHHRATDRIAYIKETTTCHYLMVVHTPRLCNDPAFQPARQDDARPITCRPVIAPNEIPEWEAASKLLDAAEENPVEEKYPVIDGIHVGGRTLVDRSGKTLQEGRLAEVAGREKVELVASKHAGQVKNLQAQDYEKLHMTPEQLDQLKENLEKLSKGKAWKLEIVTVQGQPTLRGLLDAGDKEEAREGEREEEGGGEGEEQKRGEEGVGRGEELQEPDETPELYDGPETEADGQAE
ncbi:Protein OS-9, partial [Ascosphaera atra]